MTAPSSGFRCPFVVEYGKGFLGDAVTEAEKLRNDSKIRTLLADYMTMRDACRALMVTP